MAEQHVIMWQRGSDRITPLHPDTRWVPHPECVAQWPGAESFDYHPSCCRFPKSCSANVPLLCPWPAPDPTTVIRRG